MGTCTTKSTKFSKENPHKSKIDKKN